jgi:hypothetical protein
MLTLQACAVSTTGTNFPGGLNGPPVQVSSTSCSSSSTSSYSLSSQPRCTQRRHSFRTLIETSESAWTSAGRSTVQQQPCFNQQLQLQQPQQQQQQQQQQQRQSRKRTCEGTARHQSSTASDNDNAVTQEREDSIDDAPSQCPRIQTQKLSLPRKQCESLDVSFQETYSVVPQCLVEPNALAKANFVDCLVGEYSWYTKKTLGIIQLHCICLFCHHYCFFFLPRFFFFLLCYSLCCSVLISAAYKYCSPHDPIFIPSAWLMHGADTSSGRRRRRKNAPSAISVLMACP